MPKKMMAMMVGLFFLVGPAEAKKKEQTAFSRPKVSRAAPPQLKQELMTYWSQCTGGDGESCLVMAEAYETGRGLDKNPRYAADLYQRSCEMGLSKGCYRAGMRHYKGFDGEESKAQAVHFFQKTCEMEHVSGCTNLAMMLMGGEQKPELRILQRGRLTKPGNVDSFCGCFVFMIFPRYNRY